MNRNSEVFKIYVLHANGTPHDGWPQIRNWFQPYEPLLGDVDGDGSLDIVYIDSPCMSFDGNSSSTYTCFDMINARNRSGAMLPGFPKYMELGYAEAPALADIDGDGMIELVSGSEGQWRLHFASHRGPDELTNTVPRQTFYKWNLGVQDSPANKFWFASRGNFERTGRAVLNLTPPYRLYATDSMNGTMHVSWIAADPYAYMAGYEIQIANNSNFNDAAVVQVPRSQHDYLFEDLEPSTYYVRVGSYDNSEPRHYAWASTTAGVGALSIGNPYDGDIYRNSMEVNGMFYLPAGATYEVKYAAAASDEWRIDGIDIGEGALPGWRARIAGFDAPNGLAGGNYKFRIAVQMRGRTLADEEFAMVRLDRSLADGFPVKIPSVSRDYPIPTIGKLGNNAPASMAFVSRSQADDASAAYVVEPDGRIANIIESQPDSHPFVNRYSLHTMAPGLNGYGVLYGKGGSDGTEGYYRELAQSSDGTQLWVHDFDASNRLTPMNSFVVSADVNRDNLRELVFLVDGPGQIKYIYVTDMAGNTLPGWPQTVPKCARRDAIEPGPIVANLDGDPQLEIFYAGESELLCDFQQPEGKAYAFDTNGAIMTGWPMYLSSRAKNSPASGDLDGDGMDEVVIPTYNGLFAHRSKNQTYFFVLEGSGLESPVIADLQGDGRPEIIVPATGNENRWTYVLNSSGAIQNSFARISDDIMSPVLADVDGNGVLDMVYQDMQTENGHDFGVIHAIAMNGWEFPGFPKFVEHPGTGVQGLAIADVNDDGQIELVSGSQGAVRYSAENPLVSTRQSLYMWELEAGDSCINKAWPAFHGGMERTNRYVRTMSAPYSLGLSMGGNHNIVARWIEPDMFPCRAGYAIQIARRVPNFDTTAITPLSLGRTNHTFTNLQDGLYYVRVGSYGGIGLPVYAWGKEKRLCLATDPRRIPLECAVDRPTTGVGNTDIGAENPLSSVYTGEEYGNEPKETEAPK
jgi:hypothetical protein